MALNGSMKDLYEKILNGKKYGIAYKKTIPYFLHHQPKVICKLLFMAV